MCPAGYFCPASSYRGTDPNRICPRGHFCLEGSVQPTPCPPTQYQDNHGKTSCKDCLEGNFCPGVSTFDRQVDPPGFTDRPDGGAVMCEAGGYCSPGLAAPYPCMPGYYNPRNGSINISDCLICPRGFHCNATYLASPSGPCSPGFYCLAGAERRDPPETICPKGHSCPEGSPWPTPCRAGTYSRSLGAPACTLVRPGFYSTVTGLVSLGSGIYTSEVDANGTVLTSVEYHRSRIICKDSTDFSICEAATDAVFGMCEQGYYCSGGSSTPRPLAGSGQGDLCPRGTFCPAGTNQSINCSAGTYQPDKGKDFCVPVPKGYYADAPRSTVRKCPKGFFCPLADAHAPIPCPRSTFGNLTGLWTEAQCYSCPPGMYCGSPGIDQPTGLCLAGYFCAGGNVVSAPESTTCFQGHFCPEGSAKPQPCPYGTYSTATMAGSLSNCLPCPAGRFCPDEAMSAGDAFMCAKGYYCPSPSGTRDVVEVLLKFQKPGWCAIVSDIKTTSISVGSVVAEPDEFRCPRGHKCEEGTTNPKACCYIEQPDGVALQGHPQSCALYQPNEMSSECFLCPSGFSCAQPFAGAGYSSATAPCPENYYCEEGQLPKPCGIGHYGNSVNLAGPQDCMPCPAGRYCSNGRIKGKCLAGYICSLRSICASPGSMSACPNQTVIVSGGQSVPNGFCPEGSYCPEGTPMPIACPAGTRLSKKDSTFPAKHICDCIHCSAGQMCAAGSIIAKPCGKGFYCPGQRPSADNPLRNCTPASECGVYSLPVPCPPGTYQPVESQTSSSACIACGEDLQTGDATFRGYHCPDKHSERQTICPAGHFCLPGFGPAIPCPGGTYRDTVGGYDASGCSSCDAGRYCPNGTTVPLPCPPGFECSTGSAFPKLCEGGFYCAGNSTSGTPCPAGTWCAGGSRFPSQSPAGTWSPNRSTMPKLCPIGMYAYENMTIDRTSIAVACTPCPRGTFGADPRRLSCGVCFSGYLCYGNTTRGDPQNVSVDRGEVCPAGSYASNGSYAPSQCPAGTFNPDAGQASIQACATCPRNSFNDLAGQPSCLPCGGSAVSTEDSLACQCKGANRVFHSFDSACRCKAGFTIYNGVGAPNPDEAALDGILDCEPRVMKRCSDIQFRSQLGDCVDACGDSSCLSPPCYCLNGVDVCNASCPAFQTPKAERIQIDDVIGSAVVCSCECPVGSKNPKCADPNQISAEKTYKLGSDAADNTVLTITDSEGSKTYLVPGMASVPSESADAQFIGSSPDGFSGVLDAPAALFDEMGMLPCTNDADGLCVKDTASTSRRSANHHLDKFELRNAALTGALLAGPTAFHHRDNSASETNAQTHSFGRRKSRLRAAVVDDSEVVGVQSPLVCIKEGQGIMWSITSANGVDHYPEFVTDSLFNTNPTFDFGAFAALAQNVKKGYPVTSFYHIFDQPGVYTFRDAGDKTKETVIGVVDPIVDCPRAFATNSIQPLTADLLKSFPASNEEQAQMIAPNYGLIMGIGVSMGGSFFLILLGLYVRRTQGWGKGSAARPTYRKLGQFEDFHGLAHQQEKVRKGLESGVEDGLGGLGLDDADDLGAGYVDLEGFNVQMLFDKLQDQTHLMAEQLTQQKHDVREFYDKVTRETVTLRTLVDKHSKSGFSTENVKRAERRQREIERELIRRKELGANALPMFEWCLDLTEEGSRWRVEEAAVLDQAWNAITALAHNADAPSASLIDENSLSDAQECIRKLRASVDEHREQRSQLTFGDGAILLDRSRKPVERKVIFDDNAILKCAEGLVQVDNLTGLMVPTLGAEMMYGGHHTVSVPPFCCVHPTSGKILPMEGNVFFHPDGELFVWNQAISADVLSAAVPYIVNRMSEGGNCYPSAEALYARLVPEEEKGLPLTKNRDMLDHHTGLCVPVLGVTHDLRTNEIVAVGGSMLDPETRLMKPIRIGDIMHDPESRDVLVILGVRIDEESGLLVPIGAKYLDDNDGSEIAMVFGAPLRNEFSGSPCKVSRCIADPFNPSRTLAVGDDYDTILREAEDARLLQVLDTLEQQAILLKDSSVRSTPSLRQEAATADFGRKMQSIGRDAQEKFEAFQQVRSALNQVTLDRYILVRDQHHAMYDLAATGGKKGEMIDPITERVLPILIGCFMYEESSKSDVQILDLELDEETGLYEPLGCTVIDPLSGRQVSATICGQMKDPFSGNIVPISGVRRDAGTYHAHAETNLRVLSNDNPALIGHLDSKLVADLLKQLLSATSVSGAIENVLSANSSAAPAGAVPFVAGAVPSEQNLNTNPKPATAIDENHVQRTAGTQEILVEETPSDDEDVAGPEEKIVKAVIKADSAERDEKRKIESADEVQKHCDRLHKLSENHRKDDEEETTQAFDALTKAAEQQYRDTVSSIRKSRDQTAARIKTSAEEIFNDEALSQNGKTLLLEALGQKEALIMQLLEQEQTRQRKHFEAVQLESVNRCMRKMKQKQRRERTLHSLIESGDATSLDRTVHQLQAGMEEELEAILQKLKMEYMQKSIDAVTQEQQCFLDDMLAQKEVLGPDAEDQMLAQYDLKVHRIDAKIQQELNHKAAEMERHNDDAKSRKVQTLRETASKLKAKKAWGDAKNKLGRIATLRKMGTKGNLILDPPKSVAELKSLAKDRHEKDAARLAKAQQDQAAAERLAQQHALEMVHGKQVAVLEEDFLAKLDLATDERERSRLLDHHSKLMEDLRRRQETERQRAARELEGKLAARKIHRRREQAKSAERELGLLDDPKQHKAAQKVGESATAQVHHDFEQGRMEMALRMQDAADIAARNVQHKAHADSERLQGEEAFARALLEVDDPAARERLIKEHEVKMAETAARSAAAKGKADADLQKRLEERRANKLALLNAQRAQGDALLMADSVRLDGAASAEDMKNSALQRHAALTRRLSQALDDEEAAEKVKIQKEILQSNAMQDAALHEELLTKLDGTSDEAQRKVILEAHQRAQRELEKKQHVDKERQMRQLKEQMAARKKKRLEGEHADMMAKELALLADPAQTDNALKIAVEMQLKVEHSAAAAALELEAQQEASSAAVELRAEYAMLLESDSKLQEAALKESLKVSGNDRAARDKLLQQHELSMAAITARQAIDKCKADQDLEKRLEDRRNGRKKAQQKLHKEQVRLCSMARVLCWPSSYCA